MRVESVEPIALALPLREPYLTSRGRIERRETVVLRLRCGELSGLGEGVPMTLRGGAGTGAVVGDLRGPCSEVLLDAELPDPGSGPDAITAAIAATVAACRDRGVSSAALAAADIALHDLAARALELPLYGLLGAERYVAVRCNATLGAGAPDAVAAAADRWRRRGFDAYKLKAGTPEDVETLAAVRSAVGRHGRIRIDANGAWGVGRARFALQRMQPLGLELAEQPVATVEELAELRAATYVPLAADESVNDASQAQIAVELRACDLATIKLSKVGGIAAALEIASILPVYVSSALDGPVGIAAAAHLVQALPRGGAYEGIAHGLATLELFDRHPADRGPELDGCALLAPGGPGHGVELDPVTLEELALG